MKPNYTYSIEDAGRDRESLIVTENETEYWLFVSSIVRIKSIPNFYQEANEESSFNRICEWVNENHPELLL
jgi:hypothetical protein